MQVPAVMIVHLANRHQIYHVQRPHIGLVGLNCRSFNDFLAPGRGLLHSEQLELSDQRSESPNVTTL